MSIYGVKIFKKIFPLIQRCNRSNMFKISLNYSYLFSVNMSESKNIKCYKCYKKELICQSVGPMYNECFIGTQIGSTLDTHYSAE